jgi:hypothetical protein
MRIAIRAPIRWSAGEISTAETVMGSLVLPIILCSCVLSPLGGGDKTGYARPEQIRGVSATMGVAVAQHT